MMSYKGIDIIRTIDQIGRLYQKEGKVKESHTALSFIAVCNDLKEEYDKERDSYRREVEPFAKKHLFLEDDSFLEITGKEYNENLHSLALRYIWDSRHGADALRSFLNSIPALAGQKWISQIEKGSYKVHTEHATRNMSEEEYNKKRIDIMLLDKKKKWMVVIENKVLSNVHTGAGTDESQLEIYRSYCEKKYGQYAKQIFILLSYKDKDAQDLTKGWVFANYRQLFHSLIKAGRSTENPLVRDYLASLYGIVYGKGSLEDNDKTSLSTYRAMNEDFIQLNK